MWSTLVSDGFKIVHKTKTVNKTKQNKTKQNKTKQNETGYRIKYPIVRKKLLFILFQERTEYNNMTNAV